MTNRASGKGMLTVLQSSDSGFETAFEGGVAPVPALGLTALVTCPGSGLLAFFDKATGRSFASI